MNLWPKIRKLLFSKHSHSDPPIEELQDVIGYHFHNLDILHLGLTHRSVNRATYKALPSNERLEFLGDSVLGLVIADQLFIDNPKLSEGDLTKRKAMLVNETTLALVAREIGLNKFIMLSPEELKCGGRDRPSIVSDAFEAVIATVYLDGGFEAARKVVIDCIYSRKSRILSDVSQRNCKGDLLELVQARGEGMPRYDVISEVGPDHEKIFHVIVTVAGVKIGEGKGPSKKEAEQNAAGTALAELRKCRA